MVDEQNGQISNNSAELDVSKILRQVPNHFLLAVAVAKRARQLQDGAKPLMKITGDDGVIPVIAALQEIGAEKFKVFIKEEEEGEQEFLDEMEQLIDSDVFNEDDEGALQSIKGADKKVQVAKG